jgi:hypothetical protein
MSHEQCVFEIMLENACLKASRTGRTVAEKRPGSSSANRRSRSGQRVSSTNRAPISNAAQAAGLTASEIASRNYSTPKGQGRAKPSR